VIPRGLAAFSVAALRSKNKEEEDRHVAEVHRLETEADDLYHNALADLFAPDAYTPLQVLKWNRLYDLMERAPGHLNAVRRVTR
jgi:uncharacterized protein Yka (UPF0111/DUF47 family)